MKYPQHEKIQSLNGANDHIGCFIDFLREEKNIVLTKYDEARDGYGWVAKGYYPITESLEKLLAEYFEIDLVELENEKREMLREIREKQKVENE